MRKLSKRVILFAAMSPQDAMKMFGFIPQDLSFEEINARYRHLAKLHHPDRGGSTKKMQEINEAKDVLIEKMDTLKKPPRIQPAAPVHRQTPQTTKIFSDLGKACQNLADVISSISGSKTDSVSEKQFVEDTFPEIKEKISNLSGQIRSDPVLTNNFFAITKIPIAEINNSLNKIAFYLEDPELWVQNAKVISSFARQFRLVYYVLYKAS